MLDFRQNLFYNIDINDRWRMVMTDTKQTDKKDLDYSDVLKSRDLDFYETISKNALKVWNTNEELANNVEMQKTLVKEILSSDFFEGKYSSSGLKPEDIAEFRQIMADDKHRRETIIAGTAAAYLNAKQIYESRPGGRITSTHDIGLFFNSKRILGDIESFAAKKEKERKLQKMKNRTFLQKLKDNFPKVAVFIAGAITTLSMGAYNNIKLKKDVEKIIDTEIKTDGTKDIHNETTKKTTISFWEVKGNSNVND